MRGFLTTLTATLALTASANTPWLQNVYEFMPAPGQFVNIAPEYEEGDTQETILAKAKELICGDKMPGAISLGAFGGYVIVGFDHPVVNVPGSYDFKIYGNAITSQENNSGGSSEPGIIMVSEDVNGNGIADDPWYELAGSDYTNPETRRNVSIKYFRPDGNKAPMPDPDDMFVTDMTYIRYTSDDSTHSEGYVTRNSFHPQSYWPQWMTGSDVIEFKGLSCLPDNFINIGTDSEPYFVQKFFEYGYVDNVANDFDKGFNIEWAVDGNGNPVHLNGIHFIKIYTAINQSCGWLGETSTEILGGEDLHPDEVYAPTSGINDIESASATSISCRNGIIRINVAEATPVAIYNTAGMKILSTEIASGESSINISDSPLGAYIVRTVDKAVKVFNR